MDINKASLQEVLEEVDRQVIQAPEHIAEFNATYSLDITGDDGGQHGLNFKNGTLEISEGELADADCAIEMNLKNFKKLLQGNLNPTTAFMTGRLKVKGNIGLALKLESILKKYAF